MTFWIVISFAGIACLLLTWFVPRSQVKDLAANAADEKFLAENEARKTLAQIIGGLAILIGLYSTNATLTVANDQAALAQKQLKVAQDQFALAQSGHVTDRFGKATEQLGNDSSVAARLGALLAFKQLSIDAKPEGWAVMTLLAAWIQAKAPRSSTAPPVRSKIPTDVQQALYILAFRDVNQDPDHDYLDLSGTDLRGAYLYKAQLANMFLDNINFDGADLTDADLQDSSVVGASFRGAHLGGADMRVSEESMTPAQLAAILAGSIGDRATTKLPDDVPVPISWK
jgi:hypothetical protein